MKNHLSAFALVALVALTVFTAARPVRAKIHISSRPAVGTVLTTDPVPFPTCPGCPKPNIK